MADSHGEQAEHNQRFLDSIDQSKYPDWVATVAFYKAVHLAGVLFAKKGHTAGSHGQRNSILKTTYPDLWEAYRPLYAFSRLTRYRCYMASAEDVKYVLRRLRRVEELVNKLS